MRSGPATDAWRQIVIFAALASIFLGAIAAYGQTNIKRLLAYSSINNVGFALIGLPAGDVQGASAVLFYMAVYVVMTRRRVPVRAVDARRRRRAGRDHREPVGPVADAGRASPRRCAIFMFSLAGVPPLFGFWPKLLVFNAAVAPGLCRARRRRHPRRGDRRLLLPEDRQGHVHGRAGRALRESPRAGAGRAGLARGARRVARSAIC